VKEGEKPVLFARDSKGKNVIWKEDAEQEQGRPSKVNHGNIVPSLKKEESKELNPGGFTISYALQTTVLSLAALRRLNFPLPKRDNESEDEYKGRLCQKQSEANEAARTVLAALALAAVVWNQKVGHDLRSGCQLNPVETETELSLIGPGLADRFTLSADEAAGLLTQAVTATAEAGLVWITKPIKLTPSDNLQALIRKSRAKLATEPVAE
jgi:CRISPR-associated protein Csb1